MAKTVFELVALSLCPLILAISVWIIAIKALTWTDDISEAVRALTRPDEKADRTTVGAICRRKTENPIARDMKNDFQV